MTSAGTAPAWPCRRGAHRSYLQFDGANLVTDVYVDGRHVGRHEGGYSGFRFDVTDFLRPGLPTVVAVAVDNRRDPAVAPLDGDFDLSGGLYRDVHLMVTGAVHVDALDYGGPGVYVAAERRRRRRRRSRGDDEGHQRLAAGASGPRPHGRPRRPGPSGGHCGRTR